MEENNDKVSWKILGVVGFVAVGLILGIVYIEFIQPELGNEYTEADQPTNEEIDLEGASNTRSKETKEVSSEEKDSTGIDSNEKTSSTETEEDTSIENESSDDWWDNDDLYETDAGDYKNEGRFSDSDFSWLNDDKGYSSESADGKTVGSTLKDTVKQIFLDVMGRTTNWDRNPKKIKEIKLTEQYTWREDKGGYLVEIVYRADANLTTNLTRKGILADARDFARKLFQNPHCSEVNEYMLKPHLELVDNYGNENEGQVAKIVFPRDSAEKIGNWDAITIDRFRKIIGSDGQLWLHQAIQE